MAQKINPIIPGDDYLLYFRWLDAGVPVDQTGNSVRVVVKADPTKPAILFDQEFSAAAPDAALGIIRTPIPSTSTKDFPQNSIVWIQGRQVAGGVKQTSLLTSIKVLEAVIDD